MGKRITQQARGKGSLTFRVKRKAYKYKINYPKLSIEGKAKILKLFDSSAHSAPLVKIMIDKDIFFSPAAEGIHEGKEIYIGKKPEDKKPEIGDILRLKDIPINTRIFNVEVGPGKGGKYVRSSGCSAVILTKEGKHVEIMINKRKLRLNENCRATIGVVAGEGRKIKPIVKAGKKYYMMKAIGRKWHRTSAVKVNAIDHPFGGGRGKRIKSKIAKRNAPPGKKVGHLRPRKTGRKKR